ncbi:HI0074 family nucleotidyltransferase substrate-binding subunit [[Flexibacter] sp. ATCC 35103]|uniref:HI0074 family nucleotidyltransferase substrate-binding subunit n=1 Tax=[Flexibacter] sp. ATCC 35103 TaxID=1937528 RepID=UPI0009CC9C19|nr:HI0074 family nucleotidyltransferase substrate-binding subunit [[Flexibacter] sp. ATCC 35103]OMQ12888.1 nucleotidyltransferase [[Flexibacter] sp. ATCC 35103]
MSSKRKVKDSLQNLRKATDKLESALQIPVDRELVMEGTTQRFEVTVELVWKTLQRALEYEGIHPKTPRETLKRAFSTGWLDDEIVWQDLLDKRNVTSHEYLDEEFIEKNYTEIQKIFPYIKILLEFLEEKYK